MNYMDNRIYSEIAKTPRVVVESIREKRKEKERELREIKGKIVAVRAGKKIEQFAEKRLKSKRIVKMGKQISYSIPQQSISEYKNIFFKEGRKT